MTSRARPSTPRPTGSSPDSARRRERGGPRGGPDADRSGVRGCGDVRVRRRVRAAVRAGADRKSTRLNSSHVEISYAVFCLKKKNKFALSLTVAISSLIELVEEYILQFCGKHRDLRSFPTRRSSDLGQRTTT